MTLTKWVSSLFRRSALSAGARQPRAQDDGFTLDLAGSMQALALQARQDNEAALKKWKDQGSWGLAHLPDIVFWEAVRACQDPEAAPLFADAAKRLRLYSLRRAYYLDPQRTFDTLSEALHEGDLFPEEAAPLVESLLDIGPAHSLADPAAIRAVSQKALELEDLSPGQTERLAQLYERATLIAFAQNPVQTFWTTQADFDVGTDFDILLTPTSTPRLRAQAHVLLQMAEKLMRFGPQHERTAQGPSLQTLYEIQASGLRLIGDDPALQERTAHSLLAHANEQTLSAALFGLETAACVLPETTPQADAFAATYTATLRKRTKIPMKHFITVFDIAPEGSLAARMSGNGALEACSKLAAEGETTEAMRTLLHLIALPRSEDVRAAAKTKFDAVFADAVTQNDREALAFIDTRLRHADPFGPATQRVVLAFFKHKDALLQASPNRTLAVSKRLIDLYGMPAQDDHGFGNEAARLILTHTATLTQDDAGAPSINALKTIIGASDKTNPLRSQARQTLRALSPSRIHRLWGPRQTHARCHAG